MDPCIVVASELGKFFFHSFLTHARRVDTKQHYIFFTNYEAVSTTEAAYIRYPVVQLDTDLDSIKLPDTGCSGSQHYAVCLQTRTTWIGKNFFMGVSFDYYDLYFNRLSGFMFTLILIFLHNFMPNFVPLFWIRIQSMNPYPKHCFVQYFW